MTNTIPYAIINSHLKGRFGEQVVELRPGPGAAGGFYPFHLHFFSEGRPTQELAEKAGEIVAFWLGYEVVWFPDKLKPSRAPVG